jgi:hypothetical protein
MEDNKEKTEPQENSSHKEISNKNADMSGGPAVGSGGGSEGEATPGTKIRDLEEEKERQKKQKEG